MKVEKLVEIIEKFSPLEEQEPWDNSGFQLKIGNADINKVLVAMEITDKVIDEAINKGIAIIVTHHPMIFESIKQVCDNEVTGNHLVKLIKHNICVYASHTPFDKCDGGNNDYLANLLHLHEIKIMETDTSGFCRTGLIDGEYSVGEYIQQVSDWLKIDKKLMAFCGDLNDRVQKVGICTGAGADYIENAIEDGCDLFVTGDVKYHQAQLANEKGLNLLDIGHYGSEKIFAKNMAEYLRYNTNIEIVESDINLNPFVII